MRVFPASVSACILAAFVAAPASAQQAIAVRQMADPFPLGRGAVDISFDMASTAADDLKFPRVTARFGVNDRVNVGVWGGVNTASNHGLGGVDTSIALLRQGPGRPVTVSIRPSFAVAGPADVWVATASFDVAVTRAFGAIAPYAGVASTATAAIERLNLDPPTTTGNLSYAGVAFLWRRLSLAAEVQKDDTLSYGFRVGTRL